MLGGLLPQPFQETGCRQDSADVVWNRLEDDCGDIAIVLFQHALDSIRVIERHHERRISYLRNDSSRQQVLSPDVVCGGDDVHRHGVVPAVITALKLDQIPTPGDCPGKPNGMEGRFAASHGQQHALNRRDMLHQLFSQLDLHGTDANAHVVQARARLCHCAVNVRIVVPEQGRTERGVIVREGSATVIGEGRAACRSDDQVLEARHLALCAVDPARDHATGARRKIRHRGFSRLNHCASDCWLTARACQEDGPPRTLTRVTAVQSTEPRVPSIDKALSVLELLSEHPRGLRLVDIARELGLAKSSTHLTLDVLRSRGYITRDDHGWHRLGLKLFEIGARVLRTLDIRQVSRPHLEELSQRTGLTTHLAALDGYHVVYLDRVDGHGLVRFDTYVGKRASVNLTAVGKAIAAYLPEAQLDEILRADFRRGTARAPTRPYDFKVQLRDFASSAT